MGKHLVIVGGGHAHMITLANIQSFIDKGHSVTVIGPSAYHYYSGMGPGMLSKAYTPEDIRFATKHVVEKQHGRFILDTAIRVDPKEKVVYLRSGDTVPYDVLSFNAGSHVPQTSVEGHPKDVYAVKPIEKLMEAQKRIIHLVSQKEISIGVIGGGPASVEVAGNIWRLCKDHGRHQPKIRIFAGKKLMSRFSDKIQKAARRSFDKRGMEIIEKGYIKTVKTHQIILASGETYDMDLIFLAMGVRPSSIFEASGLPMGPDGGLKVNTYLQCVDYPEVFGGGDCIYFQDQPLDKVGVYAVRENPVIYHNLMAALEGKPLQPFDPGGDYLLIFNMGDGTGILQKRGLFFSGKIAFIIKDYIDRKFMKKFQSME